MKSLLTTISILFFQIQISAQAYDIYSDMGRSLPDIYYLHQYGEFESDKIQDILTSFETINFKEVKLDSFYAASIHSIEGEFLELSSYENATKEIALQVINGDRKFIEEKWSKVGNVGQYSGWNLYPGNFYLRRDSSRNNIINVLFKKEDYIFSLYTSLPFRTLASDKDRTEKENALIASRLESFHQIISFLADELVDEKYSLFKASDEMLKAEERVYGFTQFWTEVKYNFAFFDQVPDLNWDEVYLEYLPQIIADQSNAEYFHLLEKICALLEDGHTNIYPPNDGEYDYPHLSLKNIGGRAIVQNMSKDLEESIPFGSELIKVDGRPTEEYLMSEIWPYVSSSTDYVRLNTSIRKLLKGKTNSKVKVTFKDPGGAVFERTLSRSRDTKGIEWAKAWPSYERLEFKEMESEIAYIALNTFGSRAIVEDFEMILDSLKGYKKFVIDLRFNGGGNSGNGYQILRYFADQPFQTSKWSTRTHQASYKAWGQAYAEELDEDLNSWQLKSKQVYQGNYWYVSEPDTIDAEKQLYFDGELIVLIGNGTASAAEDFLIALDNLGVGYLIGEPTFGSTGQPLQVKLPRGGNSRVCTKKDTYPDGREFIGYGIKPDKELSIGLEDFIQGNDPVLDYAIRYHQGTKIEEKRSEK